MYWCSGQLAKLYRHGFCHRQVYRFPLLFILHHYYWLRLQTAQVHGREDMGEGDCLQSRASGSGSESEADYDALVDDGSESSLSSSDNQTITTLSDDLSDAANTVDDCFDDIRCTMMMLGRRPRRPQHVAKVCEPKDVCQDRGIHGGLLPSNCYSVGSVSLVCDWETKRDAADSWSCPGRLGSTSRINISMSCNADCRNTTSGSNLCSPMQIDDKSDSRESANALSCSNTVASPSPAKKDRGHSGEGREDGGVPSESLTDVTSVDAMSEGRELSGMEEERLSDANVAKSPSEEHSKQPTTDDVDTADVNPSEIISEIEHISMDTAGVGTNQSCATVDESKTRVVSSPDCVNRSTNKSSQNYFVEPDRVPVGLFVRPSGPELGTVSALVDRRQNDFVEPDRVAVGLFVRPSGPDLGTVSALVDQYQAYDQESHDASNESNESNSATTGVISAIGTAAEMIKERVTLAINDIERNTHGTQVAPSPVIHPKQPTSDSERCSSSPIEQQPGLLSNVEFEARLLSSVQSVRTDIDEIKRVINAIQNDLVHCSR